MYKINYSKYIKTFDGDREKILETDHFFDVYYTKNDAICDILSYIKAYISGISPLLDYDFKILMDNGLIKFTIIVTETCFIEKLFWIKEEKN